jgi:hypothetical protein
MTDASASATKSNRDLVLTRIFDASRGYWTVAYKETHENMGFHQD